MQLPGVLTHAVVEVDGKVQLACDPKRRKIVTMGMVNKVDIDQVTCQTCLNAPFDKTKFLKGGQGE